MSLLIASALVPLLSSGIAVADSTAKVGCAAGHVCIYPEINYGGTPYVRRATDGSTSLADTPVNGKTLSVINKGASPKTARIYKNGDYSGPHTCIGAGESIADLTAFAVGKEGSSLKINDDTCG